MNEFFGGQLRQELVNLMDNPKLLRNHTQSSGSHRLSSDSASQAVAVSPISKADFQQGRF